MHREVFSIFSIFCDVLSQNDFFATMAKEIAAFPLTRSVPWTVGQKLRVSVQYVSPYLPGSRRLPRCYDPWGDVVVEAIERPPRQPPFDYPYDWLVRCKYASDAANWTNCTLLYSEKSSTVGMFVHRGYSYVSYTFDAPASPLLATIVWTAVRPSRNDVTSAANARMVVNPV